jgi:hypothetical protein
VGDWPARVDFGARNGDGFSFRYEAEAGLVRVPGQGNAGVKLKVEVIAEILAAVRERRF